MSEPVSAPSRVASIVVIGATVSVFRFGVRTAPFIEGLAVIKRLTSLPNWYEVQFVGERTMKRRLIYPELQRDPDQMLAVLLSIWCAECAVAADLSDFFPEKRPQAKV